MAELPVLAQGTHMKDTHYSFSSTVWLYPGMAGSLPASLVSQDRGGVEEYVYREPLAERAESRRGRLVGFGSSRSLMQHRQE